MTKNELKEWIQLFENSSLSRLEVKQADFEIRLERAVAHQNTTNNSPVSTTIENKPLVDQLKSPLVGTFYSGPHEGASPFVTLGQTVQPGDILCIVEAMKMNNEITATKAGIVTEIYVENGQAVEFDQPLMLIKPL